MPKGQQLIIKIIKGAICNIPVNSNVLPKAMDSNGFVKLKKKL